MSLCYERRVLYEPDMELPVADVVAVLGHESFPHQLWDDAEINTVWLEDVLPSLYPAARILPFTYGASILKKLNMGFLVEKLLGRLAAERLRSKRPIIFVGRDLGGVIIKKSLLEASVGVKYADVFQSTLGVIFLGTPHSPDPKAWSYILKGMTIPSLVDQDQHWCLNCEGIPENFAQICSRFRQIPSTSASFCLEEWRGISENNSIENYYGMMGAEGAGGIVIWYPIRGYPMLFTSRDEITTSDKFHYVVHRNPKRRMSTFDNSSRAVFSNALRDAFKLVTKGMQGNASLPFESSNYNSDKDCISWHPGTCKWILEQAEFQAWLSSPGSILRIQGKPGSGKSTLSSFISKNLGHELKQVFHYSYNECVGTRGADTRLLKMIIEGISSQPLSSSVDDRLHQIWAALSDKTTLAPHAIRRLLMSLLGLIPANFPTLIIIDASDEYPWLENEIVSGILEVCTSTRNPPPIKCIVSSRNDFHDQLPLAFVRKINLHEELAVQKDMALYVHDRSIQLSRRFTSYTKQLQTLACLLTSKAEASFLWVRLVIETVNEEILERLGNWPPAADSIPSSLEDIYCQCLESIPSRYKNMTSRVLLWVACARRPLTLQELSGALKIGLTHPSAVQSATLPPRDENQVLDASILELFGGLVIIEQDQTVHLVHRSVKDYLLSSEAGLASRWYHVDYFQAHELLALTCLQNLIFIEQLQSSFNFQRSANKVGLPSGESVIMEYARENWDVHYRVAETRSHYLVGMLQEYLHYKIANCNIAFVWGREITGNTPDLQNTIFSICALYGFETLLRIYLEMGTDINANSESGGARPLHLAVANNHLGVMETLLNAGASVDDTMDSEGRTALHVASLYGHVDVVRLLLKHGAQSNAATSPCRSTPLHLAALSGHAEVVKDLLKFGADPNITMNLIWETPLHFATRTDGIKQVVWLLHANQHKPKDNVSYPNYHRGSHAESHRNKLLWLPYERQDNPQTTYICRVCEHNAKVENAKGSCNKSCRFAKTCENPDITENSHFGPEEESNLSRSSCEAIVNPFAAHAATLYSIEGFGVTPKSGLIEQRREGDGWTALHFAAAYGHETIVQYLVSKGANVEVETESGKTPLALAQEHGHSLVVSTLLRDPGNVDSTIKNLCHRSRSEDQIRLDQDTKRLESLALEESWEFLPEAADIKSVEI